MLEDIINSFGPEKVRHFFSNKNRKFIYETQGKPEYNDENFVESLKIGEIPFDEVTKLVVYTIKVKNNLTERSGKKKQYEKGKNIIKYENADAGIFIFYNDSGSFRFSLIFTEYFGAKRKFSYFKRFTYFVSPRLTNKTFLKQIGDCDFSSLDKIKEAFSVEPVTKQFYGEIQNWYFWALKYLKENPYLPDKQSEEALATFLIRLITRIIFIWFLKEKQLVPEKLFDKEELKKIVKDFETSSGTNYYNAILQNLFFATLNSKSEERGWAKNQGYPINVSNYGIKTLYRYEDMFLINEDEVLELFKDIPFLNGGLFDCLDKDDVSGNVIDGFSRNPKNRAKVPDFLFFQSEETTVDLTNYGLGLNRPVRGLIEILKSYNFTIDESTPVDQEVALDPELLGKVFENLLACYNPETSTTARKATGSYYTPREIVDYMVEESLIEYLSNVIDNSGIEQSENASTTMEKIRLLLSYSDETPAFTEGQKEKIITAIANIKILDPACGSGAFPMGILHKLVLALQKLDPENSKLYKIQRDKYNQIEDIKNASSDEELNEIIRDIEETFDEKLNYPDYARKKYLIENCIYGVDIQPIAIQITKLRFFISLILDQKIDRTKENSGIKPLPNLETKFVSANTLIGLERPAQLQFRNKKIEKKEEELKKLRHQYFTAKKRTKKLKLQKKDKELREEIASLLINDGWNETTAHKISNFDIFDQNASADWFDPEWMFGVTDGFDIVIGNPPYIQLQKARNEKLRYADLYKDQHYETFDRTGDIYCLFYEKGIQLLKQGGYLCYITSNKWMRARYGEKLRLFFTRYDPVLLIDLGPGVFENATVDTNILLIRKEQPAHKQLKALILQRQNGDVNIDRQVKENAVILDKLTKDAWFIGSDAEQRLKEKIDRIGKPLKDWGVKIYRGVLTGLNEAFIITTEKRNEILANCKDEAERERTEAIIKPILRGRDIKRYYYEWAGLWVIGTFPTSLRLNINDYPALKKYFLDNFDIRQLEQSGKKYPELGFDARKKTGNKWFETQDQIAYYPEFEKEKVVWQELAQGAQFAYDINGEFFISNTGYILTGNKLKYVLGYLNSKLNEVIYSKWYCTKLGLILNTLVEPTRIKNSNPPNQNPKRANCKANRIVSRQYISSQEKKPKNRHKRIRTPN
jgi:adenine-specific DNA-methyltransferase